MRHRENSGLTLPEILVASFITFLILGMVAIVMTQLRSQAYRSEAILLSRYDLQFLFKTLEYL